MRMRPLLIWLHFTKIAQEPLSDPVSSKIGDLFPPISGWDKDLEKLDSFSTLLQIT
jgi:hypothetical protein